MDYVIYKGEKYKVDAYRRIILSNLDIKDISEIVGLEKVRGVRSLSLQGNNISEIKGFDNLVSLETLYLYWNAIYEIKNLDRLVNLKKLIIYGNKIHKIEGLEKLVNLTELNLSDNQLEIIEGLESLVNLEYLDLHGNKISEIEGLDSLTKLHTLYLNDNEISEIKNINHLTNLKKLYLDNNQIKKIKNLENLDNLAYLRIGGNKISKKLIKRFGTDYFNGQNYVNYCRNQIKNQELKEEKERSKVKFSNYADKIMQLTNDWEEFLQKSTYLTYNHKSNFLNQLKKSISFPWYYYPIFYFKIRKVKKENSQFHSQISNYNDEFIRNRLEEYSSFFEGKEFGIKYPLDINQRIAVIKDDKHNLVIAGAGSGKTSVITSRIAYLIQRKDNIETDKILALAFTNVAAKEMQERIKRYYNLDVNISTFHALGRKILLDETQKRPELLFDGNDKDIYTIIKDIFENMLKEKKFQDVLIEYLAYHIEQEVEEETFEEKEEYFRYMRNKKYSTLNNIEVNSISERNIGNFLFINQIHFQYELLVKWADESEEGKQYHPDFYLTDYDIYIEHWGLNENMEVPKWFTKTSEEYLAIREWKLDQFEKYQKTLIETWEYEAQKDELITNLKNKLLKTDPKIEFSPLTLDELIEKTHQFKENRNEVPNLIHNFIQIAKSNFFKVKDIENSLKSIKFTKKQRLFGELALEVYKRYQKFLKIEKKIDFNDMINRAVKLIKRNPEKYYNMYDHVLIDEFQDISHQRLELIKGFVNKNSNTKLFCVGDDWQSIFAFTGSNVDFFVNFQEYYSNPELSFLSKNYRSTSPIVGMSNNLIFHNKDQIKKTVKAERIGGSKPILFEYAEKFNRDNRMRFPLVFNLIRLLIDEGVKPQEIMIISRFNKNLKQLEIYCGANDIPIEEKHGGVRFYSAHKSKGTEAEHVILIDVLSGTYGFPCEIQDPSVMDVAKRYKTKNIFEEERRLFYVALTRSKKFLYIFTIENNCSMFINEILPYLTKVHIDTRLDWEGHIKDFIDDHIHERKRDLPMICPHCGRLLKEKDGPYGRFIGCSGFYKINCRFKINLN